MALARTDYVYTTPDKAACDECVLFAAGDMGSIFL